MADPPAVPDHPLGQIGPLLARDERGHHCLDLHRVGLRGPAEPPGQAPEMGIHRDTGDAEGVAEHHVRRLATHPRQRDQVLQASRDLAAVPLAERLPQAHLSFFQAEDGIRGLYVTGVQTCALPICMSNRPYTPATANMSAART